MPKALGVQTSNLKAPLVGILAKEDVPFTKRSRYVYVGPARGAKSGYRGYITPDQESLGALWGYGKPRLILSDPSDVDELRSGDIAVAGGDGRLTVTWSKGAKSNALFVTPACNCRCVMCPQPPAPHSGEFLAINKAVLDLLPAGTVDICLTGGEPTLFLDEFLETLSICKEKHPDVPVLVLSNGMKLGELETAKRVGEVQHRLLRFGIPLYSDIDDAHDRITGVQNSFYRTIKGFHHLALLRIPLEIRHVISRLNWERLPNFAEFVYRNFPFAQHVALMGLEMTGFARDNASTVWVDPMDYREALADAVRVLFRGDMVVSVYNHQLCTLSEIPRRVARQSISEWKNSYLPVCSGCKPRDNCGGFFETSGAMVSRGISPL